MSQQQREVLYDRQPRAFTEGTVENINQQWIFFDSETDEASSLEEYVHQEVEVQRGRNWYRGTLEENGVVNLRRETFSLSDGEQIKIRKQMIYSFDALLEELDDDSFFQFVTSLNSLDFSIYDCIYSYNQLSFLRDVHSKSGVNFLIFDNESQICAVQHHFFYSENRHDRFEFTLNTGKRIMIEKLNKPSDA
ncbi:DUF2777 domain-containing protein [Peribacillus psychrosaccharolyticus]|uniref:DUF2777 domain-containing protein n=1 Tax=Peribacillus psychrosaccharolyticus TaxID=1407 RepID=A0A974NQ78_PERPY|nr:DUF2777 domain-containing protein [Peribacillus psychrosaccharolyticus]MEC2054992.1 DUF2777 domain-containing protein [Peribacillus psychrosaccharolyticus]MED3746507.1 DUF2777 domain-containing protein [Peribacillus psychrosaccharolyticus]QQT02091.1 DUF2777 domain-containing protein [Peribacillus psychrosaccharolyticus]